MTAQTAIKSLLISTLNEAIKLPNLFKYTNE